MLRVDEGPGGLRLAYPAPVVPRLADVAEHVADQLAAVDVPLLRQNVLALAGQAEALERSSARLADDVLEAATVDLPSDPRPRSLPAAPRLVRRIARVDAARQALVEGQVEVELHRRVERVAAHEADGVVVRTVPLVDELAERLDLGLIVAHEDRRHAGGQVRQPPRDGDERLERRERPVVEARHRADPVVQVAEPVDRDGHPERQLRRDAADPLRRARDLVRGEAVGRDRGGEEAAALEVDAHHLGQVAAQERLAARDQKQADRRQRRREAVELLERELVLAGVDRVEAVRAAGVADGGHEVRPLRDRVTRRDPVAGESEPLREARRRQARAPLMGASRTPPVGDCAAEFAGGCAAGFEPAARRAS